METQTQALVNRLREMGYSKYRVMKSLIPEPSYRTVDAWSRAEWGASKSYMAQLQDLYNARCRELKVGLYAEIKDNTPSGKV